MSKMRKVGDDTKWFKRPTHRTCSKVDLKIKKGLRAFVSKGMWSYFINEKGNAMRVTFQQFGSCTPELFLQGYLEGLSKKKKRELSKQCDEAQHEVD